LKKKWRKRKLHRCWTSDQFNKLLSDKIGFDSKAFRLKLEESKDAKYIQIPRYDRFVEKAGVEKEDSVLYTNLK
jgi:hypothetical protein